MRKKVYYACIKGSGDIIINGVLIWEDELSPSPYGDKCRRFIGDQDIEIVFRLSGATSYGYVYSQKGRFIGKVQNEYQQANYLCSITKDCSLVCSLLRVFKP